MKMKEGAKAAAQAKGAKLLSAADKSSLIKALSGSTIADEAEIKLDGKTIHFKSPIDARHEAIETACQDLAVAPTITIAERLFLGREIIRPGFLSRLFRIIDMKKMLEESVARMNKLEVGIRSMTQAVETLSGGQRQCVAVARSIWGYSTSPPPRSA